MRERAAAGSVATLRGQIASGLFAARGCGERRFKPSSARVARGSGPGTDPIPIDQRRRKAASGIRARLPGRTGALRPALGKTPPRRSLSRVSRNLPTHGPAMRAGATQISTFTAAAAHALCFAGLAAAHFLAGRGALVADPERTLRLLVVLSLPFPPAHLPPLPTYSSVCEAPVVIAVFSYLRRMPTLLGAAPRLCPGICSPCRGVPNWLHLLSGTGYATNLLVTSHVSVYSSYINTITNCGKQDYNYDMLMHDLAVCSRSMCLRSIQKFLAECGFSHHPEFSQC
ncbi:hypothetical protein PR202_ga27204 [Eleusine coracana subsp. coracana]|uniref:Uncharacterized protein n=1 Tax=Eleusine coracana subsp. coracana TaxID=191504 RepID=A0AAV5DH26_ELECO|nr:hypothetical protein PR202_ga27204 [Eleusine coracana subsp. coracana]